MKRWWTIAKWMLKAGIVVWFVALPLMPIYGWFCPWPQADEALRGAGAHGVPLMIGGSSSTQHSWSSAGHVWREEEQRSYVVFPESLRDWKLYTYFETRGSAIEGTEKGVATSAMLLPLFAMWIVAGFFSTRIFRQLRKKEPNQAPEPTPTTVRTPAGQEARQL